MTLLLGFYAFAIGATVGSFLNVVIYRYPREESIVFPGSHCPSCNTPIRWYDNLPILSFLILRSRCRTCRAPIAARYVLIELANALFYLAIYQRTGPTIAFLPIAAIVSMTIVLIFIDLEIQILPDVIDLPGMAIGLTAAAMSLAPVDCELAVAGTFMESAIGAISGAGILLAIAGTYKLFRHVDGMGMGDVKMMAMIGSVVGWRWLFAVLMVASVWGAIAGLALAARSGNGLQTALPFGVFLGLSLLGILFFGPTLVVWLPTLRWGL